MLQFLIWWTSIAQLTIEVVPVFLLTDHFQWPEYCRIISKYWHHIDRASISPISTI